MDLRSYYRKVREADATLDGRTLCHGQPGDVRRRQSRACGQKCRARIAAKLIAEQRARVASDEEALEFHEANREAKATHEAGTKRRDACR